MYKNDFETINRALLENIKRLEGLDVSDEYARDEIMRSNAIQMSARTYIQSQITSLNIIEAQRRVDKETLLIENNVA